MINNVTTNSYASASKSKTTNSKLPVIPDILTNGQSKMSDSEIEKKMLELARKNVAAGTDSRYITNGKKLRTDEWFKLHQDYVSSASPDRQSIIPNTLSSLANKMSSLRINFNSTNFFQVLFKNSGLFGNFSNADVGSNFINFKDSNGNIIASFDEHRGWVTHTTVDEVERSRDFNAKWDNAMAKAKQEVGGNSSVSGGNDALYIGSA